MGFGDLAVYWQLARTGFARQAAHHGAMFAGLFTNVIFGVVRSAVLVAATSTGTFAGYDRASAGAYVWLSQAMLGAVQIMDTNPEFARRIKSGDIAVDFLRPIDVQAGYLAADLGRAAYTTLPRGLPCLAVGALTFGLRMPTRLDSYVLGAVSVVLAVGVAFLAQFAVATAGFWVIETRGLRSLYRIVATFLAGLMVPVHAFPGWLYQVAQATPFPFILQAPIDVLSGRVTGIAAAHLVAEQFCWLVVMAAAGQLLVRAGRRKLEVQGG